MQAALLQVDVAPESATNRYTVRPFESMRIWSSRLLPIWISVPVAAGETAAGEALGDGDGCALGAAAYGLDDAHAAVASTAVTFFFQAEDGIRDVAVTGVQTCALPI